MEVFSLSLVNANDSFTVHTQSVPREEVEKKTTTMKTRINNNNDTSMNTPCPTERVSHHFAFEIFNNSIIYMLLLWLHVRCYRIQSTHIPIINVSVVWSTTTNDEKISIVFCSEALRHCHPTHKFIPNVCKSMGNRK